MMTSIFGIKQSQSPWALDQEKNIGIGERHMNVRKLLVAG